MKLDNDNIELYLFRYKEGLLSASETAEVERALASHPEWQSMADMYDPELTLPRGVTMEYKNAESLRDGGPKTAKVIAVAGDVKRRNMRLLWYTIAAAACLILFVTTVTRFINVTEGGDQPIVVADVQGIDTIKTIQIQDTAIEMDMRINSPKSTKHYATVPQRDESAMLAVVDESVEPAKAEPINVETPQTDIPQNDNAEMQEETQDNTLIGNPMEQETHYASTIITRKEGAEENGTPASRGEQLRGLAIRATNIAANIAVNHRQRREAFEENFENNEFINNLIATIE